MHSSLQKHLNELQPATARGKIWSLEAKLCPLRTQRLGRIKGSIYETFRFLSVFNYSLKTYLQKNMNR